MKTPVEFPEEVVLEAWRIQRGCCAACGLPLVKSNRDQGMRGAWHAHHRVPASFGGSGELDNCVLLCTGPPAECHIRVGHRGSSGDPVISLESDFPYRYHQARENR